MKKSKTKKKKAQKNTWINKNRDFLICGIFVLFSLIAWLPTRNTPYFWDSAGFVIPAARKILRSNFSTIIPVGSDFAHPPFYIGLLALAWKIFGGNILVSHIYNFAFLPLLMISTYFIGKKISNWKVGLSSSILIGLTPVILAEYGVIYIDLSMAALVNCAIAFWLYRKYVWGGILLTLASMVKIPALMSLSVLGILFLVRKEDRKKWQIYFSFLLPILTVFNWLFYHEKQIGWFYKKPTRGMIYTKTLAQFVDSFDYVTGKIMVKQGRFWLLLMLIISFFKVKVKKINKELWGIAAFLIAGVLAFSYMGEFATRYGIFFLPSFYVICLSFAFEFLKKIKGEKYFVILPIIVGVFFVNNLKAKIEDPNQYVFSPPDNLNYQDMIKIGQESSQFLELNYSEAEIFGAWPEDYQLKDPGMGYVSKKLNYDYCKNFELNTLKDQVIILHPYSPGQTTCRQLLDLVKVIPIGKFKSNDKWLEIYKVSDDYKENIPA